MWPRNDMQQQAIRTQISRKLDRDHASQPQSACGRLTHSAASSSNAAPLNGVRTLCTPVEACSAESLEQSRPSQQLTSRRKEQLPWPRALRTGLEGLQPRGPGMGRRQQDPVHSRLPRSKARTSPRRHEARRRSSDPSTGRQRKLTRPQLCDGTREDLIRWCGWRAVNVVFASGRSAHTW